MTNSELLRKAIAASGYKLAYIAGVLGLSSYGLAKKINNETEFKASEIEKICNVLRIDDLEARQQIFFQRIEDK